MEKIRNVLSIILNEIYKDKRQKKTVKVLVTRPVKRKGPYQ